jgi:restriction endonuclease S subunit
VFTRSAGRCLRDLPGGVYLSFSLEREDTLNKKAVPAVGEGTILFGTMRAYLGNIAVTPCAEWIGCKGPLFFEAKSEFVAVTPDDGLTYFWLVYLRSRHFLQHLPLGSGGTRPRLHPSALDAVPVSIPDLQTRQGIHNRIQELARCEWKTHMDAVDTINKYGVHVVTQPEQA